MEFYKRRTREILRQHRAGLITPSQCSSGLNAALASLIPNLKPEQLGLLQDLVRTAEIAFQRDALVQSTLIDPREPSRKIKEQVH